MGNKRFLNLLDEAIKCSVVVVVATQCHQGGVRQLSPKLKEMGCLSNGDMTIESTMAKLSYLLGQGLPAPKIKELMRTNLRGELSYEIN